MGLDITGIGVDILKIERFAKLYTKFGQKLLDRLFTGYEQSLCAKDDAQYQIRYYAKRFAAKEAVAKALGVGFGAELSFLDIEISKDERGKPICSINNPRFANHCVHLSISDEKEHALAFSIVILK